MKTNNAKFISDDFVIFKKKRSDFEDSVFTCDKKQKKTFTAYNAFKKQRAGEYREDNKHIPEETFRTEYELLTDDQKYRYELAAECNYERSKYLWDDLSNFLLRAKGKVGYRTMAAHLNNIVSHNTIVRILKEQEGFHTRKDHILPSLDSGARERRHIFADTWWLFWLSVAAVPIQSTIFVLVHMDEKWFYSVITCNNCKVLTSIGLEPADYYAHHKSHIGKEMYIVCTAFVLTNNNDITKGGTPVNIACIRVGKETLAQKDSYKRVYHNDGTYHYPKVEENLPRKKGELYFSGLELTGSKEGTPTKPKMSLLKIYQDEIIPALERKITQQFNENGQRKVIIVKQEDGAGPHNNCKYKTQMAKEFADRNWILFNQPPQSPITNVHGACIFPMLSKAVSKEQAITFGSTLLKGDQLNKSVMKSWSNTKNMQASCFEMPKV